MAEGEDFHAHVGRWGLGGAMLLAVGHLEGNNK